MYYVLIKYSHKLKFNSYIAGKPLNKIDLKHTLFAISGLLFLCQLPSFASNPDANSGNILIVDCKTELDYGLNSYYLFLHHPVFQAHSNALEQTEFLLRKISKIKQLYPNTPLDKQHTIYIPVSFEPQSWVSQPKEGDFNAAARWILQNYDFQCAKTLLKPFPQLTDSGPYILSSSNKIQPRKLLPKIPSVATSAHNPVLVQNLSTIKPAKSIDWLEMFFKKSWQPRQWEAENLIGLHDNMLESLFHYDVQLSEAIEPQNKESSNNEPGYSPLISAEDVPSSFVALENPAEASVENTPLQEGIVEIDPSQNYPVNDLKASPPNPYEDKIIILFSTGTN